MDCCLCCECFYECCNIDDDLIRDKDTPIAKKIVSIILLLGISVCLIIVCILDYKYYNKISPYYIRAGGYSMILGLAAIITVGASAIALVFLVLYFIVGICCKSCPCIWGVFNFFVYCCIALQLCVYVIGTSSTGPYDIKCSKPLSECYYGMYNQTMKKIEEGIFSEDKYYKLMQEWSDFYYDFYLKKLSNLDEICGKILSPALTVEIIQFLCYIILILIYGGWDCIREQCCCCCSCDCDCDTCWDCGKSKEQVSNDENESDDDLNNQNNNNNNPDLNSMIPNQNNPNFNGMIQNQNNTNFNGMIPNQNNYNVNTNQENLYNDGASLVDNNNNTIFII